MSKAKAHWRFTAAIIVTALMFTLCGGLGMPAKVFASEPLAPYSEYTEETIFDENGISVTRTGFEIVDNVIILSFRITNNNDAPKVVFLKDYAINDLIVPYFGVYELVAPGESVESDDILSDYVCEAAGITEMGTFKLNVDIIDEATEEEWMSGPVPVITLDPSLTYTPEPSESIVYDADDITVTYQGNTIDAYYNAPELWFLVQNKGAEEVSIHEVYEDAMVNGEMKENMSVSFDGYIPGASNAFVALSLLDLQDGYASVPFDSLTANWEIYAKDDMKLTSLQITADGDGFVVTPAEAVSGEEAQMMAPENETAAPVEETAAPEETAVVDETVPEAEAPAGEVAFPQLYDPEAFGATWAELSGDPNSGIGTYQIEEKAVDPIDTELMGVIGEFSIRDGSNPFTLTFGNVSFHQLSEDMMMITGIEYPQYATYLISSSEPDTIEWDVYAIMIGNVLEKITGDTEISEWMEQTLADYYVLYTQNGGKTDYEAVYEGDGFTIEADENIQFSLAFNVSPAAK